MAEAARQATLAVGDLQITYLPDGYGLYAPEALLAGSTAADWQRHRDWLDAEGRLVISFGSLLIQGGGQRILVDAGWGDRQSNPAELPVRVGGRLLDSLRQAGLGPNDVDMVIYTHLHWDHVGWTSVPAGDERRLTFPNARHLVRRSEWEYWRGSDNPPGPSLAEVQEPLSARIELVDGDGTVAPGVNLIETPGHTPGHSSIVVSSRAERAIILGDVVHCPVQLEESDWSCVADVDPELGRRTRERLWQELEQPSTVTAGGHFGEFTFGRVMRAAGKRRWQAGL